MRVFSLILSFLAFFAFLAAGSGAQAGLLSAPGANPNWTKMQQFEWYLGYMARAANLCGSFQESAVLHRLARMTPYGDIGLGAIMGDGFSGPVCGGINNEAKELAADAKKIEGYLEATYDCTGEGCYGQSLSDWKFHDCADKLRAHLAKRDVAETDLREVTIANVRNSGATLDYQARVRLKNCQGSLYVDLTDSCRIVKDYTRGDCAVTGVESY